MSDDEPIHPFSNGTEFMCWNEYNCCNCKKYNVDDSGQVVEPVCEIDQALLESMFGDGTISREMADRMGLERSWDEGKPMLYWRCKEFVDRSKPDPVVDLPGQMHLFEMQETDNA